MQSNQSAQTVHQMNGWKSINNGVTTGGLFWPGASRERSCFALAPLIRLFCRLPLTQNVTIDFQLLPLINDQQGKV